MSGTVLMIVTTIVYSVATYGGSAVHQIEKVVPAGFCSTAANQLTIPDGRLKASNGTYWKRTVDCVPIPE